ncbi:AAA family ATPase [Klebsiella variicola]|uniref:AAA family ATPase n=1 Tax=Klebsiella variicola TaxID=244366 RepID=UPI0039820FBE
MSYIKKVFFSEHVIFNTSEAILKAKRKTSESNYITLIIGENGTGKSEFLKEIVEYFRIRKNSDGRYENKHIKIETATPKDLGWPKKIIASSFSLNDKFPFLNKVAQKNNQGFYKYLGIRTASNNAFTGKMRDELFHCMMRISSDKSRLKLFISIIEEFDLPLNYSFDFSQPRGLEELFDYSQNKTSTAGSIFVESIIDAFRISNRFAPTTLVKMQTDTTLKKSVLSSIKSTFKNAEKNVSIDFDLNAILSNGLPRNSLSIDNLLRSRLITLTDFSPGGDIKFQHLSSGQFHILKSIITLMAEIEDNSLILIDEPEISLHPSWQMNYMSVLSRMLSQFKNCHVIVATHSHLIVTTLPIKNAEVVVAKKDKNNNKIFFEVLEGSPSGWSADMILYSVFGVLNRNNQSFDFDVKLIASLMSNWNYTKDNLKELSDAVHRLAQYELPNADPLSVFISESKKFLKKVKSETL